MLRRMEILMDTVLGLKIDSSQVTAAVKELDRLSAATLKAEAALAKMGRTSGNTDKATRDLVQRVNALSVAGQVASVVLGSQPKEAQQAEAQTAATGEAAQASGASGVANAALGMIASRTATSLVGSALPQGKVAEALADAAAALYKGLTDTIAQYSKTGDIARDLGVGTTTLQAFERQFERIQLPIKDAQQALESFRNGARESFDSKAFAGQDSPIRKKLDDMFLDRATSGGQGREQYIRATTNDERIQAVIHSIQELQREGETLAAYDLAETAFGRSGRRIAEELAAGRFEIEKLTQAGLRDGSIIPPDVIERAGELTKRLEDAGREATTGLKPVLNDIIGLGMSLYGVGVLMGEGLAVASRKAGEAYLEVKRLLDAGKIMTAQETAQHAVAVLNANPERTVDPNASDAQQVRERVEQRRVAVIRGKAQRELNTSTDFLIAHQIPRPDMPTPVTSNDILAQSGGVPVPRRRPADAPTPPTSAVAQAGGNAAGSNRPASAPRAATNAAAEPPEPPYQRASRALDERATALRQEMELVGLGTAQREAALELEKALNALKKDRKDLTAEELRQLREQAAVVGEVAAQTERAKDAQAQKMELEGAGRDALKGILLAPTAKNPIDALVSSLDRFRQKLLDMAANELLDTLFGKKGKSAGLLGNGLLGSLGNMVSSFFGGGPTLEYAKGGVFAPGGFHAFALGGAFTNGIVHRPTLFPFANGIGLMGEAGPEAIMPLRRDSAGRLGVGAAHSGGRPVQVTVNNNAGATVTESHDGQGNVTFDIDRLADRVDARSAARIASRNSPVGNAMAGTYGLQQKPVVG